MSDLELLQEFRADLAELDPDRRARLRTRIAAVWADDMTGTSLVEPLDLDLEPESVVIPLSQATRSRSGSRLLSVRGFAGALVAVAVACLVVVGVVGFINRDRGGGVVTHLGAANPATLHQLADAARRGPDRQLGPGQYLYVRERFGVTTDVASTATTEDVVAVLDQETWLDQRGLGRVVSHDRAIWTRTGETVWVESLAGEQTITDPVLFGGSYSYEQLRGLPSDPAELEALLLKDNTTGVPTADYLLRVAAQLLQPAVLPPPVRAALFEVLASNGVRVVLDATTWLGQPGVGLVGRTQAGEILRLIVDPATGALRGWFTYTADGRPPTNANIKEWREFVDQAVVTAIDARP
ncbi:MAG: CU044_5270 family protein [Acidimicrobiales bacterium]|nr:CU044_5270 family protein [Acidimicrobiales bacterium]